MGKLTNKQTPSKLKTSDEATWGRKLQKNICKKKTFFKKEIIMHGIAGSAISNGREPRSCLGRVFNIKLGSFVSIVLHPHTPTSRVENSAQVSSF